MKNFFKNIFSSCLGALLAIAVLFLIIMMIGVSAMSQKKSVASKSVLLLELDHMIPEQTGNVEVSPLSFDQPVDIGLDRINQLIDYAATDDKIKGIYLNCDFVSAGQATLSSIRKHLNDFKASGKFIYAYADMYSQSGYYLASVADSVFLHPMGSVDVKGYSALIPFFSELMDELGVEANVFYAGNFKSATEPFRRNDMSEPNKIQTREYLSGMYDVFAQSIQQSRGISRAELDDILSSLKGRNSDLALQHNLVDGLIQKLDFENMIKEKVGINVDKSLKTVDLPEYHQLTSIEKPTADKKVALIFAEGNVEYENNSKGVISEAKLVDVIRRIARKDDVGAVVLRVNSGGGSALTSDIIYHELEALKATGKKLVASFGDLAASGGYYIAAGADTIVAAPNTITGSIGVFMLLPNVRELMQEKLYLNFDTLKTHPLALGLNTIYDLTEQEEQYLQEATDDIYSRFLQIVSTGRGMTMEDTRAIAEGRVYTGTRAIEIGLVDTLGYLEDAIAIAAASAGLDTYEVVEYPSIKPDPFKEIITQLMSDSEVKAAIPMPDRHTKMVLDQYTYWKSLLRYSEPQARLPYRIEYR